MQFGKKIIGIECAGSIKLTAIRGVGQAYYNAKKEKPQLYRLLFLLSELSETAVTVDEVNSSDSDNFFH